MLPTVTLGNLEKIMKHERNNHAEVAYLNGFNTNRFHVCAHRASRDGIPKHESDVCMATSLKFQYSIYYATSVGYGSCISSLSKKNRKYVTREKKTSLRALN